MAKCTLHDLLQSSMFFRSSSNTFVFIDNIIAFVAISLSFPPSMLIYGIGFHLHHVLDCQFHVYFGENCFNISMVVLG